MHTVEDLERLTEDELVRLLGRAHGSGLYALARARDDRAVEPEREAKSISVEDTYDTDHVDPRLLEALLDRQAAKVTERLRKARLSGRTVSIKVRLHDFSTLSRSATLCRAVRRRPPDRPGGPDACSPSWTPPAAYACSGVGVSGLADWIQEDLFADDEEDEAGPGRGDRGGDRGRLAAPRLGARAWTSCTRSTAAAGCGARDAAW